MSNYTVYNASAGSGKTYGLVKAFLKILLSQAHPHTFKNMLAITFTNKAVNEMKSRIIQTLLKFSEDNATHDMLLQLHEELNIPLEEIQHRAKQALRYILFNYSALSISTIDAFNHRIVRNFAFDLKINPNFEISTDSQTLIARAVDALLQKIEPKSELTNWLISFAKDKINNDKSWNLDTDLLRIGKMVEQENHYYYLTEIQDKKQADFQNLKSTLQEKISENQDIIKKLTNNFVLLCRRENLSEKDFNRGSVYKFFEKVHKNPKYLSAVKWDSQWMKALIDKENLYSKSYKGDKKDVLDQYLNDISNWFSEIKKHHIDTLLCQNLIQHLTPLALINQIQQEIKLLKIEENILPLYEVNKLIFNEIINQPTPFIYERIGERFFHFFIDEFQDTSFMQWNNLIPLIGNALQSETPSKNKGSLLIVGDAKQSIYRWRGGRAEQFINLERDNAFLVPIQVENLSKNYRSLPEIISFNNTFYQYLSEKLFADDQSYRDLYGKNSKQEIPESTLKKGYKGYVSISFLERCVSEEKNTLQCQEVANCIDKAIKAGASYSDICILVRRQSEGNLIADYLTQSNIQVVSSNALLVKNAPHIKLLLLLLNLIVYSKNRNILFDTLIQHAQFQGKTQTEIHSFLSKYLSKGSMSFLNDFGFSKKKFFSLPLFEGILYVIETFGIHQKSDAYTSRFMDVVLEFRTRQTKSILDFLSYWESKENEISIDTPEGINAVSIMTVHRSKGLSAPVIIFAFATSDWSSAKSDETHWISVNPEQYSGFSHLLISPKSIFSECSPEIKEELFELQKQKCIDNLNVLYVATTRPESMLFIITEKSDGKKSTDNYGYFFNSFLEHYANEWHQDGDTFSKGVLAFPKKTKHIQSTPPITFSIRKTPPIYNIVTQHQALWGTSTEKHKERGLLVHEILQNIIYQEDIDNAIQTQVQQGKIPVNEVETFKSEIQNIVFHHKIAPYFKRDYKIDTEREFITHQGYYFRPDRIAYDTSKKTAVIIDYKTGQEHKKHTQQILNYAQILTDLGWTVTDKLLVYTDHHIRIKHC